MAQLHTIPVVRRGAAPDPPILSPARHQLRQAIAVLATAQREAEAASRPAIRLGEVVAEYGRRLTTLAEHHATDRVVLADLIASLTSPIRPSIAQFSQGK